jgi:hypothetical protein
MRTTSGIVVNWDATKLSNEIKRYRNLSEFEKLHLNATLSISGQNELPLADQTRSNTRANMDTNWACSVPGQIDGWESMAYADEMPQLHTLISQVTSL